MSLTQGKKAILSQSGVVVFHCPGCESAHVVYTSPESNAGGIAWGFNDDYDAPTFAPSLLVRGSDGTKDTVCHSFIKLGKIQFLGDCTHSLAGQTVEIPDWKGFK